MITYEAISSKPELANSLIGMSLEEFDELFAAFELAQIQRESALQYTLRGRKKRQRAVGAGRKHKYALRDRLLMTLFWLRAYTTYEVLGSLYDMDKSSVEDNLKEELATLATLTAFHFEVHQLEVSKLRSVQEVLDVFPEVGLLRDAGQQRVNKRESSDEKPRDRQRSYYSGQE